MSIRFVSFTRYIFGSAVSVDCNKSPSVNFFITMVFRTLVVLFCAFRVTAINDSAEFDKNDENVVWAIAGGEAALPCDVSVPYHGDAVSMVLWFRDSTGIPLYSLDFRSGPLIHLATTDDLGARSHFVVDEGRPEEAHLAIKGVALSDEGVFRCRVDFMDSPTRNFKVNLSLVVSPSEPRIFDGQGREIAGVAGPFREGYDLYLACQVSGGRPSPTVSWWHGDTELESLLDPTSPPGIVTKQLFVSTVTRQLYASRLQCRAYVSHLMPPVIKEVQLQVYLKPMIIHIVTPNELLASGKPQALRCETIGSYPAARLSWLLDGEVIRSHPVTVTTTGNTTSSIATLILSSSDDGKDLTCRATNPWFPGGVLEESRTINVAFPPRVTLTVGSSDDPLSLMEGGDVQLICNAEARPAADKYLWYRGGEQLFHNPIDGMIVLGRTMRIRNLTKEDSGNYSCKAGNTEGTTKSQILTLTVLYVPICKAGTEPKELATLRHTPVLLRCEVDSPPDAGPVKFSWTYNKTRDVLPIPASRASNSGTVSEMSYTPQVTGDFGTLACWGTSNAGHQKYPCLFNIVPAKVPDPPQSCTLVNGSRLLEVTCQPGDDGGIPQHFVLEVLASSKAVSTALPPNEFDNEISTMNDQGSWPEPQSTPLYRETGGEPRFALHGLRPGRMYGVLVYAENARGRSAPAKLRDITVSEEMASSADKIYKVNGGMSHDSGSFSPATSQSMAMILGALVAAAMLILLAIISATAVVVCKKRGNCGADRNKRDSATVPSMYAAPDDENGFVQFNSPSVMIRPCAGIIRDARRASRALSALQEENFTVQDLDQIGEESEEFQLKPINNGLNQDIYAIPRRDNLLENEIYSDYGMQGANMYSPMIPLNYQETVLRNNYQGPDVCPQRIGLFRNSSGRNSQDFSMYAQGFGINYQDLNPNVQYARMPLQNPRGNFPDSRMSTLERRNNSQGIQTYSKGVRTDPVNPGVGTLRRSIQRDPGIPDVKKMSIDNLANNQQKNVRTSESGLLSDGANSPSIQELAVDLDIRIPTPPPATEEKQHKSEVQNSESNSIEFMDSCKEGDASAVVRFVQNKPDLLISKQNPEAAEINSTPKPC